MKLYCVSDVHSFYTPLVKALVDAGFNPEDKNHMLVLAGDAFDRGDETIQMYEFLKKMKSMNKLIYIRGNHEDMLEEMFEDDKVRSRDWSNGTVKTVCQLAQIETKYLDENYWRTEYILDHVVESDLRQFNIDCYNYVQENISKYWNKVKKAVKKCGILDFIKKNTINYFETDKYIITHSFLPMRLTKEYKGFESMEDALPEKAFEMNPNWRTEATNYDWFKARWTSAPQFLIREGVYKEDKILIFGHWHASRVRLELDVSDHREKYKDLIGKNDEETKKKLETKLDDSIYSEKNFMAIDGRTMVSGKVNVVEIDYEEEKVDKRKVK